jgi:uncharacterized protein (TIGR00369 family)
MSEPAALEAFLQRAPYIRFLGMRAELAGDEMTAILPFQPHLVGNAMIPALHGGVIGGFLEATALAQLWVTQGSGKLAKTIDVTIEYLRPGRAATTYARSAAASPTSTSRPGRTRAPRPSPSSTATSC